MVTKGEDLKLSEDSTVLQDPGKVFDSADRLYLLVFEGDSARVEYLPVHGKVVIGRSPDAHIRFLDNAVSRAHTVIEVVGGEATVHDLDSQNGTSVNGERLVGPRRLAYADTITIAHFTLVFQPSAPGHVGKLVHHGELARRLQLEVERAIRLRRPLTLFELDPGRVPRDAVVRHVVDCVRNIDAISWTPDGHLSVLMSECPASEAPGIGARLVERLADVAPRARVGFGSVPQDTCDAVVLATTARTGLQAATSGQVLAGTASHREIEARGFQIIVADVAMLQLYTLCERLAKSELPVLITGETGTGKEIISAVLHTWSPRSEGPLVTVNCAAFQDNLLESELFGYQKGAFTGATAPKPGLFETASGGTLFLDEVGEMPLGVQAKLLRVLETKRFMRLGDLTEREADVRIIAATNRDLGAEVAAERFRRDLLFRLRGANLWIPPLRDRRCELPLLARRLLADACKRSGREVPELSVETLQRLGLYTWPGNVRELKNLVEYLAATVVGERIESAHLDQASVTEAPIPQSDGLAPALAHDFPPEQEGAARKFRPIADEIRDLETLRMTQALAVTQGNQSRAAELIEMPLRTFVTKLKQYGIRKMRETDRLAAKQVLATEQ